MDQRNKIGLAWMLILDQYFDYAKNISIENGPGLSIFQFLSRAKTDGSNCEYYYATKNSRLWSHFINTTSNGKDISQRYEPSSMIIIYVQISDNITGKLFSIDDRKEIDATENINAVYIPPNLHQRNVHRKNEEKS